MSQHAGEISFPGGRIEATDASPLAAALREVEEEIGVAAKHVEVLGHLVDFLTFRKFYLAAYVGVLSEEALLSPIAHNSEVDEAFLIPIQSLLVPKADAPRPQPSPIIRVTPALRFEKRRFEGLPESERMICYWHLAGGQTLWGITGQLVATFLTKCYGWKPPGTPKVVTDPSDVLP